MAWIEIHQELPEHPKTDALMDAIGCERPAAVGHVIMSLLWALRYAHDGVIIPKRLGAIARGAGWVADPDGFASAMVEAGWWDQWGDGWKLHDWDVYAGMLLAKREKDAARKRGDRGAEHPKHVQRTSSGRPSDARMDGAGTNSTNQHDQHVHVSTDVDAPAKVASLTLGPPAPDVDVLDVVIPEAKAEGVTQEVSRRARSAPRAGRDLGRFEEWYTEYPKKVARIAAERAWLALKPDDALASIVIADTVARRSSTAWTKSDGEFVPNPANYINGKRWQDQAPDQNIVPIATATSPRDRIIAWAHGLTAGRSPADKVSRFVDRAASADGVTVDREQALAVLAERGVDEALLWVHRQTQVGKARSQEASDA